MGLQHAILATILIACVIAWPCTRVAFAWRSDVKFVCTLWWWCFSVPQFISASSLPPVVVTPPMNSTSHSSRVRRESAAAHLGADDSDEDDERIRAQLRFYRKYRSRRNTLATFPMRCWCFMPMLYTILYILCSQEYWWRWHLHAVRQFLSYPEAVFFYSFVGTRTHDLVPLTHNIPMTFPCPVIQRQTRRWLRSHFAGCRLSPVMYFWEAHVFHQSVVSYLSCCTHTVSYASYSIHSSINHVWVF